MNLQRTREMNAQLTNDMSQLKLSVSRLQQDHHVISSSIANSAQKTQAKIEKLTEQQNTHYATLLEQEQEKVNPYKRRYKIYDTSWKKNGVHKMILINA